MSLGGKIKEARVRAGLTQAQVGAPFNITAQAVGQWENGQSRPDLAKLPRLAKILGVPVEYLASEDSRYFTEASIFDPALMEQVIGEILAVVYDEMSERERLVVAMAAVRVYELARETGERDIRKTFETMMRFARSWRDD